MSVLSYTYRSSPIFWSSIYISPLSIISSSIKSTTSNSRFFFIECTTHYWRNTNTTSCRTSRGLCWQKQQQNCFWQVTFLYNYEFALGFFIFIEWCLVLPMKINIRLLWFTIWTFWEIPSSDFAFTVILIPIIHIY